MSLTYRADVDGLRAVAIIAVVAYHAGIPGFGGGFVGVDVFFVISGFLITAILQHEISDSGRVSWSRFYARRVRRLIPALMLVIATTLLLGIFLMVPDPELRWLGQSIGSVSMFVSNFFFFLKTRGYFGADAELQPLLNMWSLAVEEQFYLIWPVVLVVSHQLARRVRPSNPRTVSVAVVGLLALGSFVAAEVFVSRNRSAAFYLMPFRL